MKGVVMRGKPVVGLVAVLGAFLQTPAFVEVTVEASCEDQGTAFATSLCFLG